MFKGHIVSELTLQLIKNKQREKNRNPCCMGEAGLLVYSLGTAGPTCLSQANYWDNMRGMETVSTVTHQLYTQLSTSYIVTEIPARQVCTS